MIKIATARRFAALLAAFAFSFPATAQTPEDPRVLQLLKRMDERREARFKHERDMDSLGSFERTLAYGPKPGQTLEIHLPSNAINAPAILLAPEDISERSGWAQASRRAKARYYLAKGYAFIVIRSSASSFPSPEESSAELARALAAAQNRAADFGLDPRRFVLLGQNEGAAAVALLAARPEKAFALGARPWSASIALNPMGVQPPELSIKTAANAITAWSDSLGLSSSSGGRHPLASPLLILCSEPNPSLCEQARFLSEAARSSGLSARAEPTPLDETRLHEALGRQRPVTNRVDAFLRSAGLP